MNSASCSRPAAGMHFSRHGHWILLSVLVFAAARLAAAIWVETHNENVSGTGWYPSWVEAHLQPQLVPAHWEDRVTPGYWEDQWVSGHTETVWIEGYTETNWIDGRWESAWVDGYSESQWTDGHWEDQWHDGYTDDEGNWVDGYSEPVWIDGYSTDVWVDGHWEDRWIDGSWEMTEVAGHYDDQWVGGYTERVWVPEYTEQVWVDDSYVDVLVDGYWTLVYGTWTVTVTVAGHWEGEWVWTPEHVYGEWNWSPWTPDAATVPMGTTFSQTRTGVRSHVTWETNEAGDIQGFNSSPEYATETNANAVGTGGTMAWTVVSDVALGDWYDFTAWTPDPSTVLAPNPCLQERTATRDRQKVEQNTAGETRTTRYSETGTFAQTVPGTGTVPGGGGGVVRPTNVAVVGVPAAADPGGTLQVTGTATKGTYNLQTHSLFYAWNSITDWEQLAATPSPANPTSTIGNPLALDRTGILNFKTTAWDTQNGSTTSPIVSVNVGGLEIPAITSPATAVGSVGILFVYPIVATHAPTLYAASGRPAWLALDAMSGALTGTPLEAGTFSVTVTASNALGTSPPRVLTFTIAPLTVPGDFRATEVGSNHVALAWSAPASGPTIDFYEVSNGSVQTVAVEANRLSFLWAGLTPLTRYSFRIRAVDTAGNPSPWATLPEITTSAAGSPSGATKWIDLARTDHAGGNNYITTPPDGIKDEVIGVDQSRLVASVVQSNWAFSFNSFWSLWGVEWPDGTFFPYFTFSLMMEASWDEGMPASTSVDVALSFLSQPDQTYAILLDNSEGHDFHPENMVQHSLPTEFPNAAWQTLVSNVEVSQLQYSRYYLVRYAYPIGGISLPGISTTIAVGSARGLGGVLSVTLPPTGNVVIGIKDVVGAALKAGSDVAWEVWDRINQIRVGNSALGDLLDLGINTSGEFQVGLKLNDSATVWVNLDVQPPAPPLRSRDRYLTGSIDISGSLFRVNDLEFVNATTGENLGTYRLDGSTGTFIYTSEDDIFSEAEVDALTSGSLPANSTQLTQPVVFWKESAASSSVQFCTVFNGLGTVEIRVKGPGGSVSRTVRHTLTAEPTFAGLLTEVDSRLSTMDVLPVTPWEMLPAIEGVDDDDDYLPASISVPSRAAAAQNVLPSPPATARAVPALNLRAKGARALDLALMQSSPPVLGATAEEVVGAVNGIWDGIVSDVTGLWDLADFASDQPMRQVLRTILFYHSIRSLFVQLQNQEARYALIEVMLERFEAKVRASVPWAIPEDSVAWRTAAFAWARGYILGFTLEQTAVAMLGAGVTTKPALATKVATEVGKLAELAGKPVLNVQRFAVGTYLNVSRRAAYHGKGAMRSTRAAIAPIARQVVEGAPASHRVCDEMVVLMNRLGAEQISWKTVGNELYLTLVSEEEILKVGLSAQPLLARLSFQMGENLSASAVRGWLNLWKGALRNGANGHFANELEAVFKGAGVLHKQNMATFLEMFDRAGNAPYKFTPHSTDPRKWVSPAGVVWEGQSLAGAPKEGHRIIHVLKHSIEDPVRTASGKAHGVFTVPPDQIFPLLDNFFTRPPDVTITYLGGNNWNMTFPNFIGKADNIPGSLSIARQTAGYVPTKTVRVAIKPDGAMITDFPYNTSP